MARISALNAKTLTDTRRIGIAQKSSDADAYLMFLARASKEKKESDSE